VQAWEPPPGTPPETALVLVRPPADKSHYYEERSHTLGLELLAHLAGCAEATVVFAPRYPRAGRRPFPLS
jgi:hypothetical protein